MVRNELLKSIADKEKKINRKQKSYYT